MLRFLSLVGWLIMVAFRRGEPCLGDDGASEAKRAILDIVSNRAVFIYLVLTFAPAPAAAAFRVVIALAKHSLEGSQQFSHRGWGGHRPGEGDTALSGGTRQILQRVMIPFVDAAAQELRPLQRLPHLPEDSGLVLHYVPHRLSAGSRVAAYRKILQGAVSVALRALGIAIVVPFHVAMVLGAVIGDGGDGRGGDAERFLVSAGRAFDVFETIGVRHKLIPSRLGVNH